MDAIYTPNRQSSKRKHTAASTSVQSHPVHGRPFCQVHAEPADPSEPVEQQIETESKQRMNSKFEIEQITNDELRILGQRRESKKRVILDKLKHTADELQQIESNGKCPRHLIHKKNSLLRLKRELNDELCIISSRSGEDSIEEARDRSLLYIDKLDVVDERPEETDFPTKVDPVYETEGDCTQLGSCAKRRNKRKATVRVYKQAFGSGELVVDRFKSNVGGFTVPATVDHSDVCAFCNGKLLLDTHSRRLVCSQCCTESSGVHVFVHNNKTQKNGYQRVVYFNDLIRSETGVSCPLTDVQLETIRVALRDRKITTVSVDEVCKKMNWNKLARFRTGIVERLTGKKSPLKYTPAQHREVLDRFHIVNQSFDRLKSKGDIIERQNFPYAFFHFKLVESTTWGKPFLTLFRLPDSRPLMKHQIIWKKVCRDCQKHGFDIPYINTI